MYIFWGFFTVAAMAAAVGFFLRKKQWKGWVYSAAVLVHACGALLAISQEDNLSRGLQEQQWPAISGVVDSFFIGGTRAFHPFIRYKYIVSNRVYTNETNLDTPGFGGHNSHEQAARNIIRDYPPGKEIIVYYNPDRPQESRLVRAIPWYIFMKLGMGYLLFGLGLCLLFSKTFSYIFNKNQACVNLIQ